MNYWLCLFTGTSWTQFLSSDHACVGFNAKQIKQAQKIRKGDQLIAYLTKVSRFVAILEVTEEASTSEEKIWTEGLFPVRVGAQVLKQVPIPSALPMDAFLGKLSFLKMEEMPVAGVWSAHVRSSPRKWRTEDGITVSTALTEAISSGINPNLNVGLAPKTKKRRSKKVRALNRVGRLIKRSRNISVKTVLEKDNFSVLSQNRVTGYAVNFPIQKTCRPTAVCRDTCYFAAGLNAASTALNLQHRNLELCQKDPGDFARRVIKEYDNAGINYLRWNGGGDLFAEANEAIEYIRIHRPDLVLWIVSRKAEIASRLKPHENHYIHLSLDRTLIESKPQILKRFDTQNVFCSYQVHPDEILSKSVVDQVDLIFMHDYQSIPTDFAAHSAKFCPLNGAENIADTCGRCRRCFNGSLPA